MLFLTVNFFEEVLGGTKKPYFRELFLLTQKDALYPIAFQQQFF